jgi:hypothetical protein
MNLACAHDSSYHRKVKLKKCQPEPRDHKAGVAILNMPGSPPREAAIQSSLCELEDTANKNGRAPS